MIICINFSTGDPFNFHDWCQYRHRNTIFSLKTSDPKSPVSNVITFLYSAILAYGYYLIGCQKSLKFI